MVKWEYISEQNAWWKYEFGFAEKDRELQAIISSYYQGTSPPPIGSITDEVFDLRFVRKSIPQLGILQKNGVQNGIFLLRGPRRVGKTTYMKQMIWALIKKMKIPATDILYLNIEGLKVTTQKHLKSAINRYFEGTGGDRTRFLFIDEITSCDGWEETIQGEYRTGRLRNCITFLTGSDPKRLEEGGFKLSGSGVSGNEYIVRPLTFRDFVFFVLSTPWHANVLRQNYGIELEAKDKILRLMQAQFSLNDEKEQIKKILFGSITSFEKELSILFYIYLKTGGFPEAIESYFSSFKNDAGKKIKPTIDSKIYEDVLRAILEKLNMVGKEPGKAEIILNTLSNLKAATGTSTYAGIAKEATDSPGMSPQTAEEYIQSLKKWMLVDVLENYQRKDGYLKKIYIADPFILHSLRSRFSGQVPYDYAEQFLEKEEEKSMLVECLAGSLLRASQEQPILRETETFLYFNNSGKSETDFLFKRQDGGMIAIEVKYQEEPQTTEIDVPDYCNFCIALTKNESEIGGRIWQVPAHIFLALLQKSDKHL